MTPIITKLSMLEVKFRTSALFTPKSTIPCMIQINNEPERKTARRDPLMLEKNSAPCVESTLQTRHCQTPLKANSPRRFQSPRAGRSLLAHRHKYPPLNQDVDRPEDGRHWPVRTFPQR